MTEGGYFYGMQRRVGEVIHWQCEQRGVCKARVHTKGMEIVKRTNEHLHSPDEQAVICQATKIGIKRKARDSQDSSHQIVGQSLLMVSEGTAAKLPKLDSLKRTIQRQRVQPTSLEQLALPPEYQQIAKGEQFLLYDSGPESQRILIFGTQHNLEMLRLSDFGWLMAPQDSASPLHTGVRGACTPWRTSAYEGWASAVESVRAATQQD